MPSIGTLMNTRGTRAVLAGTLVSGLLFAGASIASANVVSAPFQIPIGADSTGQGVVMPSADGTSATVALYYTRPNTTFRVFACQSNSILLNSTCSQAATSMTVVTDASGSANATVTLPAIQELDSIALQDVADSADVFYAVVGPTGPSGSPISPVLQTSTLGVFPGGVIGTSGFFPIIPNGTTAFFPTTISGVPASTGFCPSGVTGSFPFTTTQGTFFVQC